MQGFHRTYATGAACKQRTLTPPDTWSCPTLGLACVLMSRPISPELVLSPDLWISNTPRYFSFAFQAFRDVSLFEKLIWKSCCLQDKTFIWGASPGISYKLWNHFIPNYNFLSVFSSDTLQHSTNFACIVNFQRCYFNKKNHPSATANKEVRFLKWGEYIRIKAGRLRHKELQLPKICRGTEIVRMNSNYPRSPLETNYR